MRARAVAMVALVTVAACYHRPCSVRVVPATEAQCAVASTDPCAACLKARCCASTIAWVNHEPGSAAPFGACADANCTAACTRP